MQKGEYIVDRLLPRIVSDICSQRDISLTKMSDDWVLRLEKEGKIGHIIGYKFSLNSSAEAEIAQDKVATYELLLSQGVKAVEHRLVRTKASDVAGWEDMLGSGPIVLKPLTGTSGHGVNLCHSVGEVKQIVDNSGIEAWAISPLVDIVRETRVIILDGEVLMVFDKDPVTSDDGLKIFNLGQGAKPKSVRVDAGVEDLAVSAASSIGLRLAAVDVVTLKKGEKVVLEVNDGLMMEHYARESKSHLEEVKSVYGRVVERMIG